jgi:hypothetical protein
VSVHGTDIRLVKIVVHFYMRMVGTSDSILLELGPPDLAQQCLEDLGSALKQVDPRVLGVIS